MVWSIYRGLEEAKKDRTGLLKKKNNEQKPRLGAGVVEVAK